jgi:hypothetical protein
METPSLMSSVAWLCLSWWMPISTPAAAQYFVHRLSAASYDRGPPRPLMEAGVEATTERRLALRPLGERC